MLLGQERRTMKSKILFIIAIVAIMPVIYNAGLSAGQKQARQECIDKVSENCEYICGVGADFYFPDQKEREFNNIEDSNHLEIRVAQIGDRKYKLGKIKDVVDFLRILEWKRGRS
jgi:hypothetical protein